MSMFALRNCSALRNSVTRAKTPTAAARRRAVPLTAAQRTLSSRSASEFHAAQRFQQGKGWTRLFTVGVGAGALTLTLALGSDTVHLDSPSNSDTSQMKPTGASSTRRSSASTSPEPPQPSAAATSDVLGSEFMELKESEATSEDALSSHTSSSSPPSSSTSGSSTDSSGTGLREGSEGNDSNSDGGGGAFNPETGEINWDCPCLGGMAHGPCGAEFRAAFSCFVYSEEEPKGVNCVELFKAMQNCFREHPDVYGEELSDDDEDPDTTQERPHQHVHQDESAQSQDSFENPSNTEARPQSTS